MDNNTHNYNERVTIMSDLSKFIKQATRTESLIDQVSVNKRLLCSAIQTMILMGNVLDQIKKNTYYDKPYDVNKINDNILAAEQCLVLMASAGNIEDKQQIDINPRLFHSIIGIATESTELLEALDVYGGEMDITNILEEFGDLDWYKAIGIDEAGADWQQMLNKIIEKLTLRYPDKFTSNDAINRDLKQERDILDTITTS